MLVGAAAGPSSKHARGVCRVCVFVPLEDGGEGQRTWLPSLSLLAAAASCVASRAQPMCVLLNTLFFRRTQHSFITIYCRMCATRRKSRVVIFFSACGWLIRLCWLEVECQVSRLFTSVGCRRDKCWANIWISGSRQWTANETRQNKFVLQQ